MDYKSKYLIYKQKYQELKNLINEQTGGVICSDCGKTVGSYDELIQHKRRVHNVTPGLELTPIEYRRKQNAEAAKRRRDSVRFGTAGVRCNYCDLRFYDNAYLSTHLIRDHTNKINTDDLTFIKSHIKKPIPSIYIQYIKELEDKFRRPVIRQRFELPLPPSPSPLPLPLPLPLPPYVRPSPVKHSSPIKRIRTTEYRQSPVKQFPIVPSHIRKSPVKPQSSLSLLNEPEFSYEDRLQFPNLDSLIFYPINFQNDPVRLEEELNLFNQDRTLEEELKEQDELLFKS